MEGGNTYAWRLENGVFIFENDFFTANQIMPRKMSLDDLLSMTHPDDQEHLNKHIQDINSNIWEDTDHSMQVQFQREKI